MDLLMSYNKSICLLFLPFKFVNFRLHFQILICYCNNLFKNLQTPFRMQIFSCVSKMQTLIQFLICVKFLVLCVFDLTCNIFRIFNNYFSLVFPFGKQEKIIKQNCDENLTICLICNALYTYINPFFYMLHII